MIDLASRYFIKSTLILCSYIYINIIPKDYDYTKHVTGRLSMGILKEFFYKLSQETNFIILQIKYCKKIYGKAYEEGSRRLFSLEVGEYK